MTMGILQYAGIVLVILCILAVLKKNSEISIALIIAAAVLMLQLITGGLGDLLRLFGRMTDAAGLSAKTTKLVLTITGTGYIADVCSRLCKDQGMDALSFQVETAGRILILVEAVPILENLVDLMTGILT